MVNESVPPSQQAGEWGVWWLNSIRWIDTSDGKFTVNSFYEEHIKSLLFYKNIKVRVKVHFSLEGGMIWLGTNSQKLCYVKWSNIELLANCEMEYKIWSLHALHFQMEPNCIFE